MESKIKVHVLLITGVAHIPLTKEFSLVKLTTKFLYYILYYYWPVAGGDYVCKIYSAGFENNVAKYIAHILISVWFKHCLI